MATNGVVAGGMAQNTLQRLEHILGRVRQVPLHVWRWLCLAVLALWLCYSFSQLFWLLMPQPDIPAPPLGVPANTAFANQPAMESGSGIDIETLKNLSLFGEGGADAAPVVVQPAGIEQEAVETSLRLVLHGAVPSSTPQFATAIIGDGGKQAGFNPGEELDIGPRGVKLAKVMEDRVILDNNGRYETLWLYDKEGAARVPQRNTRTAQRPIQTQPAPAIPSGDRADEFVGALLPGEDQQQPTEEQVRMVTDVLNVSMHREGGQLIGFRIRPKGDRELFEQLGLQPDDVVTAVNNVGLDDTSRAMEVYRSLGQESRATLEILRDGTTITVDLALDR
ncbi:MAG: type II secretion system protein GspC [Cellvibrionaceae bacterium]